MVFDLGYAKQLSLSRTIAFISAYLDLPNALLRGIGRSINVLTVACSKHRAGLAMSRNTFAIADMLIALRFISRT